jgi:hypothetical protein
MSRARALNGFVELGDGAPSTALAQHHFDGMVSRFVGRDDTDELFTDVLAGARRNIV